MLSEPFNQCAAPGCTKKVGVANVLCAACAAHVRYYKTFERKKPDGGVVKTTAEQEAEIVRRLRRFERPDTLAREYGVSVQTIRNISRRARR